MNASDSRFVGNMKVTNGEGTTCQMGKNACKPVWIQPSFLCVDSVGRREETCIRIAGMLVPVFSRKWFLLESTLYKRLSELRQVLSHNNITRFRHDFLRKGDLTGRV
jgi:hypothetical protein